MLLLTVVVSAGVLGAVPLVIALILNGLSILASLGRRDAEYAVPPFCE